jgi:hypothetical protein
LRNPTRYGQQGDYATWALDATPEVSNAWEFKNFGIFGALLIQVINGNQIDGVHQVGNLTAVRDHISMASPPIIFEVRTPSLVPINPEIHLPPQEDSQENRESAELLLKEYLQHIAKPGMQLTSGALRESIIDGVKITNAVVKLDGDTVGLKTFTILEYPVLGTITWV